MSQTTIKLTLLLSIAWVLTGCNYLTASAPPQIVSAPLPPVEQWALIPCAPVPKLTGSTDRHLLEFASANSIMYGKCVDRHAYLVKYVEGLP